MLWLVKAAVSAGLLAWIAHLVPIGDTIDRLGNARPAWIAAALACLIVQMPVGAWRWWRIARLQGQAALSFPAALQLFLAGSFVNQTLSVTVGGDAYRVWRLRQNGARLRSALGGVVLERGLGLVMLGLIAGLGALAVPALPEELRWLLAAVALAGALALPAMALWPEYRAAWAAARPGDLVLLALASLAIHVLAALALYCAFRALEEQVPLFAILVLAPPALVLVTLPISIGGWGVREGVLIAILGTAGLAAQTILAASVLFGILVMAAGLAGLPSLIRHRN